MQLIDLAQTGARPIDPMLHLRRDYFSGEAYTLRGYLHRVEERFEEAQQDAEAGRLAYRRYRAQNEQQLNDRIVAVQAQATNNLAYSLARSGQLQRAVQMSNKLIQQLDSNTDYMLHIADYQKALFYNTNALIHVFRGQYAQAERPLSLAEHIAQASGNRRTMGLVTWARAHLERSKMSEVGQINTTIENYYREAAELLASEPDQLILLYHDWAGYQRDLYVMVREQQMGNNAETYIQRSLDLLNKALEHLGQEQVQEEAAHIIRRADLLGSKGHTYNQLGDYEQARTLLEAAEVDMRSIRSAAYGQVVSGKIALQYAVLALREQQDYQAALRLMVEALARVYLFARQHRDQEIFERVINTLMDAIPQSDLLAFQETLDAHTLQITVDHLAYQQPDPHDWDRALQSSLSFFQDSIGAHLDI
jgi:tetratricopeptide (TPR) repeat protein